MRNWRQLAISPIGDVQQPEVRLAQFNWRQIGANGANGETLQIFGLFSKTDRRQLAPIGANQWRQSVAPIGANQSRQLPPISGATWRHSR